jgi:midasin
MSVEGEHQFDPDKEDENGQLDDEDQQQNDFDLDGLDNMDNEERADDEDIGDNPESEQMEDEDNPDHDVETKPEQKPDEDDKALTSQMQMDNRQDNNSLGTNQQKGMQQEEQNQPENKQEEQRDYNQEENDYLFQIMQNYLDNQEQKEKNKPKEGERNEDPNIKNAENIQELEDLPEEAEAQDENKEEGQDFAKDDKSKDIRSNVADMVKYNDEEMEPNEEDQPPEDDKLAPKEENKEEMDVDEKDKNLDEVKDSDPIKSMLQTNEFYQKYLEDKNKKKEEEKKAEMEVDPSQKAEEEDFQNNDKPMLEEEEKDKFELMKEEYIIKETDFDILDLKKSMIIRYEKWRKDKQLVASSYELLNKFKKTTHHLSISLCEQMRMILEPTEKSRLKGDYKSGKRINIKKIIPFIASNYRNDKIWLRREMPFKRDYRVMIAIDDSLSMKRNNLGFFALESLVAITEALNQLNVGKV